MIMHIILQQQRKNIYKRIILLILVFATHSIGEGQTKKVRSILEESRDNCVKISVHSTNSLGTGFFLDDLHIATCFHVIGSWQINQSVNPPEANILLGTGIKVLLEDGEVIDAEIVTPTPTTNIKLQEAPSPNTQTLLTPVIQDFAVLKLKSKPKAIIKANPIYTEKNLPQIGSDILFSGYPFGTPAMITHKGMISGMAAGDQLICIQAPINKGNSGGALLTTKGEIIGIVSDREGGISLGLQELSKYIENTKKEGSVLIMGVDQLAVTKEIIQTLDTYISTGIGYARPVKYLKDYLNKNPEILKK